MFAQRIAIAALLLAAPGFAVRLAFDAFDPAGRKLEDAEVCAFPASLTSKAPIERFFYSNDIRCHSADAVIAFPPGRWNFFGRHANGMVTAHPLQVVVGPDPELTDTGLKVVNLRFVDGAFVDARAAERAEGEWLSLYFPSSESTLPHVVPLASGSTRVQVPADMPFVPFLIRGGRPTAIGELHAVKRGGTFALPAFDTTAAHAVTWLRTAANALQRTPPQIRLLTSRGDSHTPLIPNGSLANDELVVFRRLAREVTFTRLAVSGPMWRAVDVPAEFTPTAGVKVLPPIELAATGAVRVTFSPETVALARANAEPCGEYRAGHSLVIVELCPVGGVSRCERREVRMADVDDTNFESVEAGAYDVRIRIGGTTVATAPASVAVGDVTTTSIAPEVVTVSGRVTRGGTPVEARLQFVNGTASSDRATGAYVAAAFGPPPKGLVTVLTCDPNRHYFLFLKEPPGPVLDIDLPGDARIRVTDRTNGQAIGGAATEVTIMERQVIAFRQAVAPTGSDGVATLTAVPLGREFSVCARAERYTSACSAPLDAARLPETIELALEPAATRAGRVTSPFAVANAMLFFVSRTGEVTESIRVSADGTFALRNTHSPDEHVVLVSPSHPLTVLPLGDPFAIVVPPAQVRSVRVSLSAGTGDTRAPIALSVGDRIVPVAAWGRHQAFRGEQVVLQRDATITIRDLLQTGHIWISHPPTGQRRLVTGDDAISLP